MKWKYIKRRFRYNPKRAFLFLSLFIFLTSFTIGYAFLTRELSIEGSSTFVGATWDIHFENIQVKGGSVTPTTAASITNPTTVTFEVQLDNPGDFYEFNIDVVNDGTFNAMIDSYSFLPVLTAEQQEYLEYTVTYSDGVPLAVYQKLDAGTQETLKIRFGYIDGIDTSLYPLTDQELTIEVEIVYVQADENAIDIEHGQRPVISSGMIPVKIANDGTVTAVSKNDSTWYDYNNKIWANAVLVTDTNRSTYQAIADGNGSSTTIPSNEILAYYVWIPRYSYKIWTLDASSSHQGQEQTIDIKFVDTETKELGTTVGSWYTHPAFTFGTEELSGFWAGKFEMSHTTLSSSTTNNNLNCSNANCANANGLRIVPNAKIIAYNNTSNMFYSIRSMEQSNNVFGITLSDSHMMKNTEWGAVAYLSHSNYGINDEIRINNYVEDSWFKDGTLTGCGAGTPNASYSAECDIIYGNDTSYPQSTTGNISGIFDMSGGLYEQVMGNYNGTVGSSGFGSMPAAKYYDKYTSSVFTGDYDTNMTFCTISTCGGHALNETRNWYSDVAYFVRSSNPWFLRGGYNQSHVTAGAFYSNCNNGSANRAVSWRAVLVDKSEG